MASKLFMEGKQLTGAVGNALKINCKDKDGKKSTVQAELNKLNNEVSEQGKNLVADDGTQFRFGVNENGEYGYIVTDKEGADTVIPFKKDVVFYVFRGNGTNSMFATRYEGTSLLIKEEWNNNDGGDECFKISYTYPNFSVTCLVPCIVNGVLKPANTAIVTQAYNSSAITMAIVQ